MNTFIFFEMKSEILVKMSQIQLLNRNNNNPLQQDTSLIVNPSHFNDTELPGSYPS